MAVLKNFIYCLRTDQNLDGIVNVEGVMSVLQPEYVPGMFSFSIFFTLLGLSRGSHSLRVEFRNPNGEVVTSVEEKNLEYFPPETDELPAEQSGLNIVIQMQNVVMRTNGMYNTTVQLDDTDLGEFEIYVKGRK